MSGKLDQSLDDILSSRPRGRAVRRGRRAGTVATKATTRAPAGGIQKNTKTAKTNTRTTVPSGPAAGTGDSKIIVSNLPSDVNEQQIKEYFGKSVGPVRRAMLTYGPNGTSRGIATIIFNKPGDANNAAVQLNGMLVDKRPMKIEVVVDPKNLQPAKTLSDRIGQPKGAASKPKPATEKPATNGETRGGRAGRGRGGKRGRNAGRPKPKTADELDAEMMDYFDANAANGTAPAGTAAAAATAPAANGTTAAGAAGDVGMEEIS